MVAEPLTCILQSDCLVANLLYCLASCLLIASEVVEQLTGLFLLHPKCLHPLFPAFSYTTLIILTVSFPQTVSVKVHQITTIPFFEQRLFMGNWLNSEPIFLCHDKD